jgi:hypothetical protein
MSARRRPTEHAANVEQKVGDLFGDFAFRFGKFGAVPFRFALDAQISGAQEVPILLGFVGRGSWIRTNDLQYPKLPRYQAALYPEYPRKPRRYTLKAPPARRLARRFSGR